MGRAARGSRRQIPSFFFEISVAAGAPQARLHASLQGARRAERAGRAFGRNGCVVTGQQCLMGPQRRSLSGVASGTETDDMFGYMR